MTRARWRRLAAASARSARLLAALLVIGCSPEAADEPGVEGDRGSGRPNVLFLLAEDQGAQLGLLDTPGLETPNLDRLAREGVYFREAFVNYPVCSPSKAVLFTGLYSHANGLRANTRNLFKPASQLTPSERADRIYRSVRIHEAVPTLIEILRDAGYVTGIRGSFHVAPNEKFPYDEFMRPNWLRAVQPLADLIAQARQARRPWFLLFGLSSTHRPFRDSTRVEIGVDPRAVVLPAFLPDTPIVRRDWSEYLDSIEQSDALVGQLLEVLEASGEAERTIVFFMSDHGPAFQRGKMSLHDLGLRVPLAVRGPGVARGLTSDALASGVDLMPTILDLLGLARPPLQHGRSLKPILEAGEDAASPGLVFAEISHAFPASPGLEERAVYDGRFRMLYRQGVNRPRRVNADLRNWKRWRNRTYRETVARRAAFPRAYAVLQAVDPARLGGRPPRFELYDRQSDPDEVEDLARSARHREILERMAVALGAWAEATDDADLSIVELRAALDDW